MRFDLVRGASMKTTEVKAVYSILFLSPFTTNYWKVILRWCPYLQKFSRCLYLQEGTSRFGDFDIPSADGIFDRRSRVARARRTICFFAER